jgi:3D (Asp-Asp-Asp) domain-containing protein
MKAKRIAKGILWIIWWSLKGSILVGIFTRKIKSEKKRNYVVIAFDIIVIAVFLWWALSERTSYQQGVNDCAKAWCDALPNLTNNQKWCPTNYSMFGTGYTNQSEFWKDFTSTGTELP